jgi:tRNA(fMet)-specific endonuclease VapC
MYLIDTDILIYFLKGNEKVSAKFRQQASVPKALSVVSYGELYYGAMRSARCQENLARIRRLCELMPVLDVSRSAMETYGCLKADLHKDGAPVDEFDLIIAATALSHGMRLVTNNLRHYARIPGLDLENWNA